MPKQGAVTQAYPFFFPKEMPFKLSENIAKGQACIFCFCFGNKYTRNKTLIVLWLFAEDGRDFDSRFGKEFVLHFLSLKQGYIGL